MNNEKPLVVALDFDDVCIDFNTKFAEYNRIKYGTSYEREHIQEFGLSLLLKCSPEEVLERAREFVLSELHEETLPIDGAVQGISYLHTQGVHMPIVTARDELIKLQTLSLVEKHFPGKLKDTHFLHRNNINVLGEKGEVCKRLCADFLFEDALHNALHHSMKRTHVLLFDTPWNQTEDLPKHVTRVYGWGHALEIIEKRSR